jgi:putative aminopeptidase FrvX
MIDTLTALCSIPTAPFAEQRVIDFITDWVKLRNKLKLSRDRFGNRLVELKSRARSPRTVMVAHLDHPGFIAQAMTDRQTLHAKFHGTVFAPFFVGTKVRFFDLADEITGVVTHVKADEHQRGIEATLRVKHPVATGSPGMWDVGDARVKKNIFYSRCCDDLAGCAAALSALDVVLRSDIHVNAAVLFTRAEEAGLLGSIGAAIDAKLLRKTDRIISIETSAEQPYARQGDGVIIRTGDRTSIFNSAFTQFIQARAQAITASNNTFKHHRALMPGGTCEATVFDAFGYTAAAVCIPLGNYHNMNQTTKKIAAEFIHLHDWHHMVTLLADVCAHSASFTGTHADLQHKLTQLFKAQKDLL